MSVLYRPPWSFRPPLAYGGHLWHFAGSMVSCRRCMAAVPRWALTEGMWMVLARRWCPGMVRALPAGPPVPQQLALEITP